MENLAITYSSLGRHQDALALQEKALEVFESAENHPHIGVRSLWVFMPHPVDMSFTCSVLGTAMMNLGIFYSSLERHDDALVLREKTLDFQRRVLPENHPDIGVRVLFSCCCSCLCQSHNFFHAPQCLISRARTLSLGGTTMLWRYKRERWSFGDVCCRRIIRR
jgi:hypothetical protein